MAIQYSSRFTIAIHIMLCIDQFSEKEKVTSNFLSGSIGVNPVIIRNVLLKLQDAGLITTAAGVGGSKFAKDTADITLLDIFKAVEDSQEALFHFHENPNPQCPVGKTVHAVLDERLALIQQAMEDSMSSITLKSILEEMRVKQQTL